LALHSKNHAEDATIAIIVAAAIIVEEFFIIVFVFVIIFLLFIFFRSKHNVTLHGNKNGDKFQVRISSLDSKSAIEQPIFISSCYYNNQCLLEDGAAA
jgi:hypothetical protein